MFILSDVITYIRRIIKSPSNSSISDDLIIDYINRFYIVDVDARIQLFDLKTKYSFMTTPGVDRYNMPLYNIQVENVNIPQNINFYPVYQGFLGPAYINGVEVRFDTQQKSFFNAWPNIVQYGSVVGVGNGTAGPYTLQFPIGPGVQSLPINPPINSLIRGHIDITGIISTGANNDPPIISAARILNIANDPFIQNVPVTSVESAVYFTSLDATGSNVIIQDSGQFLDTNINYGILMQPGKAPTGNLPLSNGPVPYYSQTQNTINYQTGIATNVYFPSAIPNGNNITAQGYFFQSGLPRGILFYNNVLTLRSPPAQQYLVELDAYLSPAAYLNGSSAIQFAYMSEYIARGAARKILSDTGDMEQLQFYEPFFIEQEMLVWKRSQRQWTATRTETLYSRGGGHGQSGNNNMGGSNFF